MWRFLLAQGADQRFARQFGGREASHRSPSEQNPGIAVRHHGRMPDRTANVDAGWRAIRAASPAVDGDVDRGRITFLGHSTVLIEVDDLRILTDPVLREGIGPVRRQVQAVLPELFADLDAVFISHGHHDHLDPPSLRRIPGKPTLIVPKGFRRIAEKAGLGPVEEVEPGDRLTIDRVRFEVLYADHSGRREPMGPSGPAIGCVIAGSRTVYFPGDTDLYPAMGDLVGRLDVAMLPVWGWGPTIGHGHMNPVRAAAAAAILRPRLSIPIHWGTFYPAGMRRVAPAPFDEPGREFETALARFAPDLEARVLLPGDELDLPTSAGSAATT
jgi:L-ascorbate metabolism protein UlaG (beta-lactamase superfamily)